MVSSTVFGKKEESWGGEWVVMHQKEIMPECVLELVRELNLILLESNIWDIFFKKV